MAKTAWRCSQCGAINEPGSRACRECGKWPSLFDLQESVDEQEQHGRAPFEVAELEPTTFEPQVFEPEVFEAERPERGALEEMEVEGDEPPERRGRIPRWAVTAIWIVGILIWIVANAFRDGG